jgi:hypothetical protein
VGVKQIESDDWPWVFFPDALYHSIPQMTKLETSRHNKVQTEENMT